MLLSTSVDTVLGDVFADTSTASETIAAEPQHGFMNFVRSSKGHIGAYSTPRLSQPEAVNASLFAQSAARSGLLANWHAHVPPATCLLVSLKVHCMHMASIRPALSTAG